MYRPQLNFNVPMKLLIPKTETINGVPKKTFPKVDEVSDDFIFFGDFRTFGGTERDVNGMYTLEDTAVIDTWYRPDIQSDCNIVLLNNGHQYEIVGTPEDIEMRHQFMKFKVKRVGGKP